MSTIIKENIPIIKPYLGGEEKRLALETISDNWITGGKKVWEFEKRIASLTNAQYAISCVNGTMALYMGLVAMGIGQGDEVIVPDFTFIASANAVILAGAKPIFCDIDQQTLNIDTKSAEVVFTHKTKAIMPVHIYGQSADMGKVLAFALSRNLKVIEDAAQGLGVKFSGYPVGALGNVGIISFYADKLITCGEGGMVITNDAKIADNALMLEHQGRHKRGIYLHENIGYNFRMTDLAASIGIAQLNKLEFIIEQKKYIEKRYRKNLESVSGVALPFVDTRGFNIPFRNNILVDNPQKLAEYMESKNISTMRFFYPLHKQPCYKFMGLSDKDFPNSIRAYEHGLSLPSWVGLSDEQIDYICQEVINGIKNS
jgi:perosamine synthetase